MITKLKENLHVPLYSQRILLKKDSTEKKSAYKNVSKQTIDNIELIKKPASMNFCGLSTNKLEKIFKNEGFKKTLEKIHDYQLIFGPAFALILTCIFRPAAIMTLPGKKNKDDKKYAAAHSISSGVIGFILSTIMFTPISNAINKFKANPKEFITNKNSYLLKDEKALATMRTYIDRMPDVISSVPKGILTIAVIPPILKYVFGWEKKKHANQDDNLVLQNYHLLNFHGAESKRNQAFQSFMGGIK
jgi:hypothetical protein